MENGIFCEYLAESQSPCLHLDDTDPSARIRHEWAELCKDGDGACVQPVGGIFWPVVTLLGFVTGALRRISRADRGQEAL
jgi:hypothetical protein